MIKCSARSWLMIKEVYINHERYRLTERLVFNTC